jgi:hypothetical protein
LKHLKSDNKPCFGTAKQKIIITTTIIIVNENKGKQGK